MPFLEVSHNSWLVAASLCVALMAGFTGLSLTKGLSSRSTLQKKVAIVMAAVALGGGIWSMHFVAMLGLQLPILFYYDAAVTLASALVAILVTGIALLILHFTPRTTRTLVLSGTIVGLGILAMHYIGMAGMQLCRALYTPPGVALAVVASCSLNILAFSIAYGKRTHRNIAMGTICFGLSVFAVHFIAIAGTRFMADGPGGELGPLIGNEQMALGVVLSSFVICGAFLLSGVTFWSSSLPDPAPAAPGPAPAPPPEPEPEPAPEPPAQTAVQIPYEKEGRTLFIDTGSVAAIRAEGHYTHIYTPQGRFFCAWSITEAEKRLTPGPFLRAHRSFLVNPAHVSSFERMKDSGVCHLSLPDLPRVPVSRTRLKAVRDALGV